MPITACPSELVLERDAQTLPFSKCLCVPYLTRLLNICRKVFGSSQITIGCTFIVDVVLRVRFHRVQCDHYCCVRIATARKKYRLLK